MTHFVAGDQIVWRIIWFGRVWWALPATVVEDTSELVALYVAPHTPFKAGGVGENPRLPPNWQLTDRSWSEKPVLQLTKPGEAHSVWVFWSEAEGVLAYWYVNLQEPLRRTPIGFDTRDNMLDIVIESDLSGWRWKDEDDVADAVATGLLTQRTAQEIRAEGERFVALFKAGTPPFDPTWADWRPPRGWPIPGLPDGWAADAPPFGEAA